MNTSSLSLCLHTPLAAGSPLPHTPAGCSYIALTKPGRRSLRRSQRGESICPWSSSVRHKHTNTHTTEHQHSSSSCNHGLSSLGLCVSLLTSHTETFKTFNKTLNPPKTNPYLPACCLFGRYFLIIV